MRILALLGLSLLSAPLMAACVTLSEEGLSLDDSERGAAQATWQARLENRCERAQDVMLTVRFVDAEGKRVYDVRDQLVLERLGQLTMEREVYVPAMYIERIEGLEILVNERERPF